jgi:hypothetical protein
MTVISEKPTAPAAASSRKPRKHFQGLRQLFTSNKANALVFPHDAFHKYQNWEDKDYITEAIMGSSTCPSCATKILVSRQVQMKGNKKLVDNLRFEQAIEGGAGRSVKTMPTSFNEDYIEFKKCRTEKSWNAKSVENSLSS